MQQRASCLVMDGKALMAALMVAAAVPASAQTAAAGQADAAASHHEQREAERQRRAEQRRLFRPPAIFGNQPPLRGYRPPITITSDRIPELAIPFPFQFNLPQPAPGLIWVRSYNDAILYDPLRNNVLEIRARWFGP